MCSGLLTSSANGASAALASAERGAWMSSRMLQSLCTMSALSAFVATCLFPDRRRKCRAVLRGAFGVRGQEVAGVPQGAPERRLRGTGHHQMSFAGPNAELAGSRVVGDQRGERGVGALHQAGKSAIVDLSGSLGNVVQQAHDRVGKWGTVSRRQEFADFLHLP